MSEQEQVTQITQDIISRETKIANERAALDKIFRDAGVERLSNC